jgi:hypothetical protein
MGEPHLWKASALLRSIQSGVGGHHQDVAIFSFTVRSPFVAVVHASVLQGKQKTLLTFR